MAIRLVRVESSGENIAQALARLRGESPASSPAHAAIAPANGAAKTSKVSKQHGALFVPPAAGDAPQIESDVTAELQAQLEHEVAYLNGKGGRLERRLSARRMYRIFKALKAIEKAERSGRKDECAPEKLSEVGHRREILTMRIFAEEACHRVNISQATLYRWVEQAEALVACLGERAANGLVGKPIANDSRLLGKLPQLPVDEAEDVVRVYTEGAGKRVATRMLKERLHKHRLEQLTKMPETPTVGSTVGDGHRNVVLYGDVLTRLRELSDESVQCVVTSPPFFNQRDFGTRSWSGGDPACAHDLGIQHGSQVEQVALSIYTTPAASMSGQKATTDSCAKCGAWFGQLGLEPTIDLYVAHLVSVFREVRRVLRSDGVAWVEIGDTCNSGTNAASADSHATDVGNWQKQKETGRKRTAVAQMPPKNVLLIPERLALAFQADGWIVRSRNVWHKTTCLPESVKDRPTVDHTLVYQLVKSETYYYDHIAVLEPVTGNTGPKRPGSPKEAKAGTGNRANGSFFGAIHRGRQSLVALRNLRSVWSIPTGRYEGGHVGTFPPELPARCIRASTSGKGACASCGAPWHRVVQRDEASDDAGAGTVEGRVVPSGKHAERDQGVRLLDKRVLPPQETIGWEPTCDCGVDGVVPCVVLDPFAGSGTTLAVAMQLGCSYVGVELNEQEYRRLIEKRLAEVKPAPTAEATVQQTDAAPSSKRRPRGLAKANNRAPGRARSA